MRTFTIFLVALSLSLSASAQDLLVKRNGEKMKVKVLKITKKKVEFVRHGTELPVYTLPISDIEYIEYPMGDRDTFGRAVAAPSTTESTPNKLEMWNGPVPTPDGKLSVEYTPQSSDEQKPKVWHGAAESKVVVKAEVTKPVEAEAAKATNAAGRVYNIGDIYNKDGVVGIVVMLQAGGQHGLIMSLDEACLAWSKLSRREHKKTGASDRFDGAENMKAIEKYITENGLSWDKFPAFKWCREKGEGWYLPSINEIWSAGTMYMGGSRTSGNRHSRKNFNANLTGAGGTPMSNIMIYHSSTEDRDVRYALYSHMNSEPPYTNSGYKADELFVRAFHKF